MVQTLNPNCHELRAVSPLRTMDNGKLDIFEDPVTNAYLLVK
jgi:hypothetical protein